MADLATDAAAELCDHIVKMMLHYGADPQVVKNEIYLLMRNYQITEKTMEMVPYKGDKNGALLNRFILAKMSAGLSRRTLKAYHQSIKRILQIIGRDVEQISPDDIRYYLAMQLRQGVSKTTCNNDRHYLSSFFAWLTAEELIPRNPMLRIEALKQTKEKKRAFEEDDLEKMRIALRTWRERAMFEMLLSTGCRVSELVSIRITDIADDGSVSVLGKGSKYRTVYLNAKARLALQKYTEERADLNPFVFPRAIENFIKVACTKGRSKTCEWYREAELVDGEKAADAGTIEKIVRDIGKRAGVENAHPHRFRRTCATNALRKGMPLELVSKMLGHDNVATTQIYLDLGEDDLKQAHRRYVT